MQPSSPDQPPQTEPEELSSQLSKRLTIEPINPVDIEPDPIQPKLDVSSIYPTAASGSPQIQNSQIATPVDTADLQRRRRNWTVAAVIAFFCGGFFQYFVAIVFSGMSILRIAFALVPYIVFIVGTVQAIRLRPDADIKQKMALDILLGIIVAAELLVAAIWHIASTCQGVACGDIVLLSFGPMGLAGLLSMQYLTLAVLYFRHQSKHHSPIAKRFIFGFIIALIAPIGLSWLFLTIYLTSAAP